MKRTYLIIILGLAVVPAFSQKFEKGNVVGSHVGTVVLNPDVTYNQFKTFLLTSYIPEVNKAFGGDVVMYFGESDRGTEKNIITYIYVIKSIDVRNKYFPTPDKFGDAFTSVEAKIKPMADQLAKLGTYSEKYYADWIVQ